MKNFYIQDSPTLFKLEYTRTSKDYFDLTLAIIASLFCLVAFSLLIYNTIVFDFSWFHLFISGLFGFGAFMAIAYALTRWSDTSQHVLYFDKMAQKITIRHSLFSKRVLAIQDVMRLESQLHTDMSGSSENPKRRYWGEINLILKNGTVKNLIIINTSYELDYGTLNVKTELKKDCTTLAKELAAGLGTVARWNREIEE